MDISEIRKKAKKKNKKKKKEETSIENISSEVSEIISEPVKEETDNDIEKKESVKEDSLSENKKEEVTKEENESQLDFIQLAGETLLSRAFINKDFVVEEDVVEFLGIKIDKEDYGLNIESVVEITKLHEITKVPLTPDYVKGIISLRGKVHTLISLRKKFELEEKEPDQSTRIIVVNNGNDEEIAVLVDEVTQVFRVSKANIEPHPVTNQNQNNINFVEGIAKGNNLFLLILDVEKVCKIDINDY